MPSIDLNDPVAVLLAASHALERAGIEAATYGGLALAVYGEARETKDADLAVASARGEEAAAALRALDLDIILAINRMTFGGQFVSRLSIVGGEGGSLNTVDLVEPRSGRYGTAMLGRVMTAQLRQQDLPIVSPEDFVVMKVLATRDRDLEDAASVIRSLQARIDIGLIERELNSLALEIPDHQIIDRWQRTQSMST